MDSPPPFAALTAAPVKTPLRPRRRGSVAVMTAVLCAATVLTPAQPVRAQGGLVFIRDTEIEAILHKECDPVFVAAGLDPRSLKIHLVQGPMNAMTMSGQEMAITTDLITTTENPNQLIGVMAHESGHAAGGHPLRSGEMERAGMAPMLLTLGLGILAAGRGPGQPAQRRHAAQRLSTL